MYKYELSQEDLNSLKYIDVSTYKTEKQKLAIQYKEQEQSKKRFKRLTEKLTLERNKKPKKVYLNQTRTHVLESDITEEMEELETELWAKLYF